MCTSQGGCGDEQQVHIKGGGCGDEQQAIRLCHSHYTSLQKPDHILCVRVWIEEFLIRVFGDVA